MLSALSALPPVPGIDRCSLRRLDTAWLEAMWSDPTSRLWLFRNGQPLVASASRPLWLAPSQIPDGIEIVEKVFLGARGETACFAVEIAEKPGFVLPPQGSFGDLRAAFSVFPEEELALGCEAKGVLEWHRRHRFCSCCGGETEADAAGFRRLCGSCGTEHFPRLDPAALLLPIAGDFCLLARNVGWVEPIFSAVAGFVEPGESLEEAAQRELGEETGLRASSFSYFGSQPWPFPSSLMIAYFATCEKTPPQIDPTEIAEAAWFSRSEARHLLQGRVAGKRGPTPGAIADRLIRAFCEA